MNALAVDARRFAEDVVLRDGASVRIRAIRPDDRERLLEHFASLSRESVYSRFLGFKSGLTVEEMRRYTGPDFRRHVGLVATTSQAGHERIVGVARYLTLDGSVPPCAEMAVAVSDDHQGRGIGTALLERLARIAITQGICRFEADILGDNERMMHMLRKSGLPCVSSRLAGVVHVCLAVDGGAPSLN